MWLYPLLFLLPLNMVVMAHTWTHPRLKALIGAGFVFALSLPLGWFLFKNGLSAPVEKYGLTFTGADFLLGPDRRQILPQEILVQRWAVVQTAIVLTLSFGMALLLRRQAPPPKRP